jgi:hypothetical protein
MADPEYRLHFSIEDVQHSARFILASKPEPIVSWRLLHEVLGFSADDPELAEVKAAALQNKWVRQLEQAQLADGSFGRFHSQDTKQQTIFRTSEEAIDRAFALGLGADHPVLTRLRAYIQQALQGQAYITDPDEKNDAWPVIIRFILAGRLAQIEPSNSLIIPFWQYLIEVAESAFKSGTYRLEDEAVAYKELSGIHVPKGFLESQHALWILSSQPLARPLEVALLGWVWNKPDGIRYIRAPLSVPESGHIGYWVRSMNLLSRLTTWQDRCMVVLNELWDMQNEQGWWDFGKRTCKCVEFPLSENWRRSIHRKMDYSVSILTLLRKCFD